MIQLFILKDDLLKLLRLLRFVGGLFAVLCNVCDEDCVAFDEDGDRKEDVEDL